ncbi:MAG TPA: glycoside hydrolase 68 family protein [Parvularcula sp.]|nr:glycoside hydrolase 68 family protein [Parvularcula sp.]HBS32714.1 glycoside hydrolase 68 family protein [Parvularcula sp.]HBS34243.1 glycoside hydrolase 68 family protein [Parvularcula sp.]
MPEASSLTGSDLRGVEPLGLGAGAWTAAAVATLEQSAAHSIPLVAGGDIVRIGAGLDFWDMWPVQRRDGAVARFDGAELWMALSAPALPDPAKRHDLARIRLLVSKYGVYSDCGDLLPADHSPGSREWAGSSIVDDALSRVTLFFTAAGRRGDGARTFEQRLFETSASLSWKSGTPVFESWSAPVESVASDGEHYVQTAIEGGLPGHIKAFRDPAYFRDPADGREYLLFAASLKKSRDPWNGAVGAAVKDGGLWRIAPPLLSADGVNNELERPHIVARDGAYYLFWSTQRHMFSRGGPAGPNGLYGMRGASMAGPWLPLNGSGLVAGNPEAEPYQTYSWLVLDNLEVVSFIDFWGLNGRAPDADPALLRKHFGGAPAPRFRLAIDGLSARIV